MRMTALVLVLTALGLNPAPSAAVQLGAPRAANSVGINARPIGRFRPDSLNLRNTAPAPTLGGVSRMHAPLKPAVSPALVDGGSGGLPVLEVLDAGLPEMPQQPAELAPERVIGGIAADIAPDIEGLTDQNTGTEQASGSGVRISDRLLGRQAAKNSGDNVVAPDHKGGDAGLGSELRPYTAREISSPMGFLEHAKSIALVSARNKGYGFDQVYFGDAAAYLPGNSDNAWMFTFYIMQHPGQTEADQITVVFKKAGAVLRGTEIEVEADPRIPGSFKTSYHAKEYYHTGAPVPKRRYPVPLNSDVFAQSTRINPDMALEIVRKKSHKVGRDVSLSFRMRRPDASGAQDLWYYVFDSGGATFVVNGRTGEILERRRVERKPSWVIREKSIIWEGTFKLALAVLSLMLAGGLLWGLIRSYFDS